MDFQERVKQELYALFPRQSFSAWIEWNGLLRGGGVYRQAATGEEVSFTHRDLAFIKKIIHLQKVLLPDQSHVLSMIEREGLHRGVYYRVDFKLESARRFDRELEQAEQSIFSNQARGFEHYFRGLFEARGYIGNPRRSYHLELPVSSESLGEHIKKKLSGEGLEMALRCRKDEYSLYTKRGNTIGDLLRFMGAPRAFLDFEKIMVEKSTVNDITRWLNCETANLSKMVNSSTRWRQMIARLDPETLPPALQEVASLRVKHPFLSLRELAARCNPALSKSEVFRRLQQIEQRALHKGVDRK